jgi:hypothetical protein
MLHRHYLACIVRAGSAEEELNEGNTKKQFPDTIMITISCSHSFHTCAAIRQFIQNMSDADFDHPPPNDHADCAYKSQWNRTALSPTFS